MSHELKSVATAGLSAEADCSTLKTAEILRALRFGMNPGTAGILAGVP
jgi:hypothetical protein